MTARGQACSDCAAARANPEYRTYNPGCLWCGARYVQGLRTWPPPMDVEDGDQVRRETAAERKAWMARVLDAWERQGHSRDKMRELAEGADVPYQPDQKRKGKP